MGKTPLPRDEALQPLNVKVPMEDLYFLQEELKPALGTSYNADAMRQVLAQLRTWFRLPAYVVERLKKDAAAEKLHLLERPSARATTWRDWPNTCPLAP